LEKREKKEGKGWKRRFSRVLGQGRHFIKKQTSKVSTAPKLWDPFLQKRQEKRKRMEGRRRKFKPG